MNTNGTKILIVEDDEFISEIYYRKLSDSGFDVRLAMDGLAAITIFKEFKPKIVLLDIMLPKKDGMKVLAEIKAEKEIETKVIMLTNLDEKEKIKEALEIGAEDYLVKSSLTPAELVEIVRGKI